MLAYRMRISDGCTHKDGKIRFIVFRGVKEEDMQSAPALKVTLAGD